MALRLLIQFARAEDSDQPYAFSLRPQDYILPTEGGGSPRARFDWNREVLADLHMMRQPGRDPEVLQRLGERLRAFVKGAGWEQHEQEIAAAAELRRPVFLTIRSSAAELYALPWELLTLKTGQFLGELPGLLLRYEWPEGASQPPTPRSQGGRILLAWSAAAGAVPGLEHLQAIRSACEAGCHPFDVGTDVLENASLWRIVKALEKAQQSGRPISILHLLCHGVAIGKTFGIRLNSESSSGAADVTVQDLRQHLGPFASMLRLIVLSACDGGNMGELGNQLGSMAQALHRCGFAAVIASRYPLSVSGSITLTEALYGELLSRPASLETAFLAARTRICRTEADRPRDERPQDWVSIQLYARHSDGDDSRPLVFAPYRGLLPFGPQDRRFFFGRAKEQEEVGFELQELIRSGLPRFQIIEGPSGVGKSSLALAGVVPVLAGQGWAWRSMRPGNQPMPRLEAALGELEKELARPGAGPSADTDRSQARRQLLVVDQLEEIFTHLHDSQQRDEFVQRLWQLATVQGGTLSILCTLRIDYRGRCSEVRLVPAAAGGDGARLDSLFRKDQALHNTYVQQMTRADLQEVIEKPAGLVGLAVDPGLSSAIVEAAGNEPGALAIMQHTLDLLWQRRVGQELQMEAYQELGGLAGALKGHANKVMESFDTEEDREQARNLLVALVARPGEHAPYTRCAVPLSDLRTQAVASGTDPEERERERQRFLRVYDKLLQEKLIVVHGLSVSADAGGSDDSDCLVEVAHEMLIRTWAELGEWVRSAHAPIPLREQLRGWIAEWQANPQALLSAARLASAEQFASDHRLPPGAAALIKASREAITLAEQRAAAERIRLGENTQRVHDRMRLTAARLAADNPTLQALLLREVERPREVFRRHLGLLLQLLHQPIAAAVLRVPELGITCAAVSSTGSRVAAGCEDHNVRIWRSSGIGEPLLIRAHKGRVTSIAFSAGGSRIVTASADRTARVFRSDGSSAAALLRGHSAIVNSACFSPDGTRIVTASDDRTVRVWRADGGAEPLILRGHKEAVRFATFSPDGRHIVSVSDDRTAQLWRVSEPGEPMVLRGHEHPLRTAAFSPDSRRVVTVSSGYAIRVWNVDGPAKPVVLRGHQDAVNSAAFSPDGNRVVTASADGTAQIFRSDGTGEAVVLRGHTDMVNSACFSRDGTYVLTASDDHTARLWRSDGSAAALCLRGHADRVRSATFFRDGTRILTQAEDGAVRVFQLDSFNSSVSLRGATGILRQLSFSPDNTWVVGVCSEGYAWLGRTDAGSKPILLKATPEPVRYAACSPDSTRILTVSKAGAAQLFQLPGGPDSAALKSPGSKVTTAAFSRDGTRVITGSADGTVAVFHRERPADAVVLRGPAVALKSAALSPDGSLALTIYEDGEARLFRCDSDTSWPLRGHRDAVTAATFSPDGSQLLTGAADGVARVFRLDELTGDGTEGLQPVTVLHSHVSIAPAASYSLAGISSLSLPRSMLATSLHDEASISVPQLHDTAVALRRVVFSADGTQVALSADSGLLVVYRLDRPEEYTRIREAATGKREGNPEPCWDAFFLPDQLTLLYGSPSGLEVFLRRTDRPEEEVLFARLEEPLSGMALSADGTYLATATGNQVGIWPFSPEHLKALLWRASSHCLPPEERMERLGESEEEARSGYAAALEQVRQ